MKLLDYIEKMIKQVDEWPEWKKKSIREGLQLSKKANFESDSNIQSSKPPIIL